jgi:CheY-like chemotaxis protein
MDRYASIIKPHRHCALVVDDEKDVRDALVAYLESHGYRATGASGVATALHRLKQEVPCVAVVDVSMPELDGWDFLEAAKRDPALAELAVVMITGSSEHAAKAARFGVQIYFNKPADPKGVATAIATLCPKG